MEKLTVFIVLTLCRFSVGKIPTTCTSLQFECESDNVCIPKVWKCDGEADCKDRSDERNCEEEIQNACSSDQFKCKSDNRCIPKMWKCDGEVDCKDQSDEMHCGKLQHACTSHQFECESNNYCIPKSWKCDGEVDCKDQSDEKNCDETECISGQFKCESDNRCIPIKWICDGVADCKDQSDEMLCEEKQNTCTSRQFKCESNNICIPITWKCDGDVDCKDRSDEINCDTCEKLACSQKCETTINGSRCYCNKGFYLDERDNRTCNDIDECLVNNICSQKCINTVGSYRCICYEEYDTINDTCIKFGVEDSELIFFNEGSNIYIKKRKAGTEEYSKRIESLPKSFRLSSKMAKITGLSFQPKTQVLYVADGEKPAIYAVNMSLHAKELVTNNLSSPEDIAFDWMSDNLYWVDADKGTTEVISVNTLHRKVLIEDLSKPVSLALSPHTGTMFIAEVSFEAWISIFEMDGTNKRILHSVQGMPMSLTLHPSKTLLLWSDIREEVVSYVNYSSSSPPRTLKRVKGVMSVAVSEDSVFYTTEDTPLQSEREREPTEKIHEMKLLEYKKTKSWKSIIYSYGLKPSMKSECLIENGGCSYLCLTSLKGRTCACSSAMKLEEDGRTCVVTP